MANERQRRANAGRKIGTLLDQELDGDEFYKNVYGGFDEASEDEEYQVGYELASRKCFVQCTCV